MKEKKDTILFSPQNPLSQLSIYRTGIRKVRPTVLIEIAKIWPPTLLTSTSNPKSVPQTKLQSHAPLLESIPVQKIRVVGLKEQMVKFNQRTTSRGCHRTRPDNPSCRAVAKEKQNYASMGQKEHGKHHVFPPIFLKTFSCVECGETQSTNTCLFALMSLFLFLCSYLMYSIGF